MRRTIRSAGLLLFLLLWPLGAWAEETVTACGITVSADATATDFGEVLVTDVGELVAFLDEMPQLEIVDMYASRLSKTDMDMLFTRYPQITFGWTYRVGDHTVRTDITAFSTLHGTSPDPTHSEREFQWSNSARGSRPSTWGTTGSRM